MPKPTKTSGPAPFHILFAGQEEEINLVDGSTRTVWVRAMPVDFLLSHVMRLADRTGDLINLCTYLEAPKGRTKAPEPAHPEIPPPHGYINVPAGFSQNVKPASARRLFKVIKELNFTEAAAAAEDAVAAKEWQTPLIMTAETVLMPIAQKMADSLSSALTAQLSSAAPKKRSGSRRSRG